MKKLQIIDATTDLLSSFDNGLFNLEMWKSYMDYAHLSKAKEICFQDMEDSIISAGLEWGKDYLPVLNSVPNNIDKINRITQSFYAVTENLPEKISNKFGKTLDVDIILYLGLCNGAGWVTTIGEKTTVLLGIEKIIELDWCDIYSMNGLILHELGHVYQDKYGVLNREIDALQNQFLWQLFTEGIAMVFEQEMVDNPEYYHQDKDGWKNWCTQNLGLINQSFCDDLATMTSSNQRYFGDWVRFHGYSDVGYYLGAYFVRFLLRNDCFDNLISYSIDDVRKQFKMFSEMNH